MDQASKKEADREKALAYAVDVAHPNLPVDIGYGAMTFLRNNNPNGISPTLHEDEDGGAWLRLAVAKDAYTKATDGDPEKCDRCELRDRKLPLGTPVWYSFEMRAERGFPMADARFICAQIKAPYYDSDGGSPLFALRIDRGRYVATVEHLYEETDVKFVNGSEVSTHVTPYQAPGPCARGVRAFDHHVFGNSKSDYKELQVRALLAADSQKGLPAHLESELLSCTDLVAVTQGSPLPDDVHAWWRFTLRVAPTNVKDADGVLELSVADPRTGEERLIARANGEFGHAGSDDPETNTGPAPGDGLQYFKLGPYRDKLKIWGDAPAAIHVRNVARGYWKEGAELRARIARGR